MSVTEPQRTLPPCKRWCLWHGLIVVAVIALLLRLCVPIISYVALCRQFLSASHALHDRIAALAAKRPSTVSPSRWQEAVDWTNNLICQVYFTPSDEGIVSLKRLSEALDRKAQGPVNFGTLRWIWDAVGSDNPDNIYPVKFWDDRLFGEEPRNDASLPGLRLLNKRWGLDLSGCPITSAGLKHLEGLGNLHALVLEDTQISDTGLEQLQKLPNLERLYLNGCAITDAGLNALQHLPHLAQLDLSGTQVTDDGVKKLQQALPDCKIEWKSPTPPAL